MLGLDYLYFGLNGSLGVIDQRTLRLNVKISHLNLTCFSMSTLSDASNSKHKIRLCGRATLRDQYNQHDQPLNIQSQGGFKEHLTILLYQRFRIRK